MEMAKEFEGKTVDDALQAASQALGIPAADLSYDLVEEGRRGVFGLGVRQVRIMVELPPEHEAKITSERQEPSPVHRSIEETLHRMLRLMGMELRVRAKPSGNGLQLHLGGPDRRMLLQKDAQLLSALQFLLIRMARRAWPEAGRIQVLCDGHRNRRDEEVVELVREVASQVARTGAAKQLHPMNPYERRLAHITVREFSGLASRSEGDGFLKKITVTPAGSSPDQS